jgi:cell wall-associated NlpC family hydrolase
MTPAIEQQVVEEARTWLGTPWHHNARVKGAGVDCAQLLIAVFRACGLAPEIRLGYYPPDWHMHRDEPRFLRELARYADPVYLHGAAIADVVRPGDVAMFNFGRHAAHGAIVTAWPEVVHAYRDVGQVTVSDVRADLALAGRLAGFWRVREPGERDAV